jgi:hypothetical protein
MPKADPIQYLMNALAILTGGLITDMQTLILGLVVCAFILMALDILKDLILLPALEAMANPFDAYRRASAAYATYQINRRISAAAGSNEPGIRPSRSDLEISPLRQHDLEFAADGIESLEPGPDATYANNHWENDGVDLSEDRYSELEDAVDESYRRIHRMSDEDAAAMVSHAADDYRRRNP